MNKRHGHRIFFSTFQMWSIDYQTRKCIWNVFRFKPGPELYFFVFHFIFIWICVLLQSPDGPLKSQSSERSQFSRKNRNCCIHNCWFLGGISDFATATAKPTCPRPNHFPFSPWVTQFPLPLTTCHTFYSMAPLICNLWDSIMHFLAFFSG